MDRLLDAGGYGRTPAVYGNGPALVVNRSNHAVEANLRSVEDDKCIAHPDTLVLKTETDDRRVTLRVLQCLELERRKLDKQGLGIPELFLAIWHKITLA